MRNSLLKAWIMPFKSLFPDTVALPMALSAGVCRSIEMSPTLTAGFFLSLFLSNVLSSRVLSLLSWLLVWGLRHINACRRQEVSLLFLFLSISLVFFGSCKVNGRHSLRPFWWLIGKLYCRHCSSSHLCMPVLPHLFRRASIHYHREHGRGRSQTTRGPGRWGPTFDSSPSLSLSETMFVIGIPANHFN